MSNKKRPCIDLIQTATSQLTVFDNYYMCGWQSQKYDSCQSLKDYQQVNRNVRRYLRRIHLEGSIRLD
jgi:hypothetical protein